MRRTRRSPAARVDGRRLDGVETARDSGRRAGRGGVTAPPLVREQIGQFASRRLWRQKGGARPSGLERPRAKGGAPPAGGAPPRAPPPPRGARGGAGGVGS